MSGTEVNAAHLRQVEQITEILESEIIENTSEVGYLEKDCEDCKRDMEPSNMERSRSSSSSRRV